MFRYYSVERSWDSNCLPCCHVVNELNLHGQIVFKCSLFFLYISLSYIWMKFLSALPGLPRTLMEHWASSMGSVLFPPTERKHWKSNVQDACDLQWELSLYIFLNFEWYNNYEKKLWNPSNSHWHSTLMIFFFCGVCIKFKSCNEVHAFTNFKLWFMFMFAKEEQNT